MRDRYVILSFFILVSIGCWYFLDGFILRPYITIILLLFSALIFANDFIELYLFRRLDSKWFTMAVFPGTVLHEFSHAFAAILFGGHITDIKLFDFNSSTGTLGWVEYAQPADRFSVLRSFAVGFAPFFGCGIVLIALFNFTLSLSYGVFFTPRSISVGSAGQLFDSLGVIFRVFYSQFVFMFSKPLFAVLLYLQVCLGLGAAPSSVDFKGSFSSVFRHPIGAILLLLLFLCVFVLGEYSGLSEYVVFAFNWVIFLLFVSLCILISSIPVIYGGSVFARMSYIKKFIVILVILFSFIIIHFY